MHYCTICAGNSDINSFFVSERNKNVECEMHLHGSVEIVIVTEGILCMEIDRNRYVISKGEAVFVPAFVPHSFHSENPNHCHVLMFLKDVMPYFSDFLEKNTPESHLFKVSQESFTLVERILPLEINHANSFSAHAVLGPLICEIYEKCRFSLGQKKKAEFLVEALEYLELHFMEDITLESTAKAVGVHPVTISKYFSKLLGTSFSAHLNYLRCSYAAILLCDRKLSCTEAAFASGYNCIRSFNRAFRRVYGVTPSEYQIT